jgi:YegS/Rv2252/BmrU family lipid kinase
MDSSETASLTDLPYRRALIVANPISGRGRGVKAATELEAGLKGAGLPTELFLSQAPGDAFTRLRSLDEACDLVVAVGGDGTLREILEGLVDPEIPVGVLPFGTANVLAMELGFPRDVHHCLEILARKQIRPLDVATVNGHLSFLVTGVGLDAMAVREVARRRTGPITRWSYVDAMLRTLLRYQPPRLRVSVDDEPIEGEFGQVIVSNLRRYAGFLNLAADARIDDGVFELYLFPTGKLREMVGALARGVLSRLPGGAVTMRRARRVRIEAQDPVPYQIDGEEGGETPVEIDLAPNQYRLVVP